MIKSLRGYDVKKNKKRLKGLKIMMLKKKKRLKIVEMFKATRLLLC